MSFTYVQPLPTPEEIKYEFPLPSSYAEIKKVRDEEIAGVLTGKNDRFMVIIGPCSADNESAVCEYVSRLAGLYDEVRDRLILIPRIYTNKPRTTGSGYKGITSQPDPEQRPDFRAGLIAMRKMHIHAIEASGLTSADEMLYPENWGYVEDILSYVAIGARSVEDQQHRLTVSGFDVAAGMKNPTSGDLTVMLNSVYAAQHPHEFTYRGHEVMTSGNPLAHTVLRGSVNPSGRDIPNYHYEDLVRLIELYDQFDLKNPACVIDTNHSNSGRKFKQQIRIAKEILHNRTENPEVCRMVKGLMIESYLEEGTQKIGEGVFGKSITDPCLGWEDTRRLILEIAEAV
ncbi:MAG: 3-deoxy-7-phosphoheptulonate synthase [Lachnospiraceae bacterium]|nr:3-deoxy-7-phosphoheptulonate synthase [Lachnospiraceae bacterium]